jgi:anti-sigma factor RsiW
MTNRTVPVTEDELHAFVDGELPEDRRLELEAWLEAHPEDAARIAAWKAQGEAIRERYAGAAEEPVPERFDLDRLVRQGGRWRWIAAVAAVMIAFGGGGLAGWFGRGVWDGAPAAKAVVAEALDAHRLYIAEVRHPIEVPAEASHLIPWLSRKIGHQIQAPNLKLFNLKLMGGRLLPSPRSPAALFMYEGPSGERFTLYCVRASAPDTALRYREAGQVAAFYWVEGQLSCVVSGPSERDRLQKVAESAYEQLDSKTPGRGSGRKSTLLMR